MQGLKHHHIFLLRLIFHEYRALRSKIGLCSGKNDQGREQAMVREFLFKPSTFRMLAKVQCEMRNDGHGFGRRQSMANWVVLIKERMLARSRWIIFKGRTDFVSKRNHKKKSMHQALSKSVIITMLCPNMREAGSDPQGNNMSPCIVHPKSKRTTSNI